MCSLVPSCLNGSESVTVDFGEEGQDRLLLTFPRRHRGRRLADFEDVLFEVSLPTTGGESEDGEPQTGSKQAAAMFNSVADEVRARRKEFEERHWREQHCKKDK